MTMNKHIEYQTKENPKDDQSGRIKYEYIIDKNNNNFRF